MKITTQFDLGQKVWAIYSGRKEYTELCAFCDGHGRITGADGTRGSCPKCFGRGGKTGWHEQAWHVDRELTVGQVRVAVTDSPGRDDEEVFDNFKAQTGRDEEYMCVETGVGSGTVWKAAMLFATHYEAQAECDQRNSAQVSA